MHLFLHMHATVRTSTLVGIEALPVDVQAIVGKGLPGLEMVGSAEAVVREARVRIRAAFLACGRAMPQRNVVINLAPADVRKSGAALDLAIAVAIVRACEVQPDHRDVATVFLGELGLDGTVRPIRGVISHLLAASRQGLTRAIIPRGNAEEAAHLFRAESQERPLLEVLIVDHFVDVLGFLEGHRTLVSIAEVEAPQHDDTSSHALRLEDVRGQVGAKRALELAALGEHPVLFIGPPGVGKTMLAERLVSLLPDPTADERLEIAAISSITRTSASNRRVERPFRAPHHTASYAALVGGGSPVQPGEVTRAHRGVLFLDELPEFGRASVETLREVLEARRVVISRVRERVEFPAAAWVVAAMNPCPCGYATAKRSLCRCAPGEVTRYASRVSGPLLDRFELQVHLHELSAKDFSISRSPDTNETRDAIKRISDARLVRADRRGGVDLALDDEARRLLDRATDAMALSGRARTRAAKLARTIADLAQSGTVSAEHLAEALSYRIDLPGHREREGI